MSSPNKNEQQQHESLFIQKANTAARRLALHWIRSVFEQVTLQTLQRVMNITKNAPTSTITITQQHLNTCERTCERLGRFWCQRLRDAGQAQMADWVNQVVVKRDFWQIGEGTQQEQEGKETEENALKPTGQPHDEKEQVEPLSLPSSGNKLILTKIRKMGQRKAGERGPPSLERVSRTLDQLGRSGQTEWPYDWSIIQQAAKQNVKRLHSETIKGRPLQKTPSDNYEVVPKSLVERDGASQQTNHDDEPTDNNPQQQENDVVMASSGRLTFMVERKRKASAALMTEEPEVAQAPTPLPIEMLARAPSTFGNEEHLSWNDDVLASLSQQDRQYLERTMIHPDEANTEMHSVLGALKDVGGFHMYLAHRSDTSIVELNDKKRRRLERKARKQRMFPHVVEKEDLKRRVVTKVLRTIDASQQEHYMELDMGECLMEILDPNSNQKKLCAFSSMEVSLKDDDASPADHVSESQPNS